MSVVLVTGGARGLGRGTVAAGLRRGWTMAVADLSHDADLPEGVEFHRCDVAERGAVEALVADLAARHGRLVGVHVNAGVPDWEPFLEMAEETVRRVFAVNLEGVWRTAQAAARQMAAQGSGALVLTSSVRSLATNPLHAAYGATKGATNSLVTALATELGPLGIRVNGVLPGACESAMQDAAAERFFGGDAAALGAQMTPHIPLGRLGRAEEVGEVVAFLLSEQASYVHGALIPVDGGLLSTLT